MATILACRDLRRKLIQENREMLYSIGSDKKPSLLIIDKSHSKENETYTNQIMKACEESGIICIKSDEIKLSYIKNQYDGIIVLNPFDREEVMSRIDPSVDIDGITYHNLGRTVLKNPDYYSIPCTAAAVLKIIKYFEIPTRGINTVIIGRSPTIGMPVSNLLINMDANVSVFHSKSGKDNIIDACHKANLIILATNQVAYYDKRFFGDNKPVIIDCGFGMIDGKPYGCLDTRDEAIMNTITAYTPVPGGVGMITPAILCRNVIENFRCRRS